jgi:hypothetical protein
LKRNHHILQNEKKPEQKPDWSVSSEWCKLNSLNSYGELFLSWIVLNVNLMFESRFSPFRYSTDGNSQTLIHLVGKNSNSARLKNGGGK